MGGNNWGQWRGSNPQTGGKYIPPAKRSSWRSNAQQASSQPPPLLSSSPRHPFSVNSPSKSSSPTKGASPPRTPPSSQSNWRASATAVSGPLLASDLQNIEKGLICELPMASDVPATEAIHSHPDFSNPNAFGHPCVVLSGIGTDGLVTCAQMTAFSNYSGGLLEKYKDIPEIGKSFAECRKRWLLCAHSQGVNHDNLPMLSFTPGSVGLHKPTYVNTENFFRIHPRYLRLEQQRFLWVQSFLSESSVNTIIEHHYAHYPKSSHHYSVKISVS